MKNKKIFKSVILLMFMLVFSMQKQAFAKVPYKTMTQGPNEKIVETQTAYEPQNMLKISVTNGEDIFIDEEGLMYIADTGNSRVVVLSKDKVLNIIGEGVLKSPSGLYVDKNKKIYVADYGNKKVYIFDKEGKLIKEIERPKEPLYGKKSDFIPKKLVVDGRGNIYVISQGSINGIIQLNNLGEFTGYFGSNKTNTSFKMILQRTFFTEEQMGQLFKNVPPSASNVVIDKQGLIYTTTKGIKEQAIKKINIAGKNLLSSKMVGSSNFIDIDVDEDGNIYGLDEEGFIYEYDSFGNLIFVFGGKDVGQERIGLIKNPAAIAVSKDQKIYVLDKEKAVVQCYKPTQFAKEIHKGISLYKEGLYVESEANWKKILKMNSSFILSYEALAKSYFKRGEHKVALEYFKLAEDKKGYSNAFWEIRNMWMQQNLAKIIVAIFILCIIKIVLKKIDSKKHILNTYRKFWRKFKSKKLVSDVLFIFYFIKQPIDGYYELKKKNRASILSATILYVWLFILQITKVYLVGYIFNDADPLKTNVFNEGLKVFVPTLLWLIANYLVSTINDGEGRFRDLYRGTIYSLAPYLIFALPLQLVTNVLSLNERFVYDFSMAVVTGWSMLLLFLMVKEIHNYTVKETIRNIFITIFGMVIIILIVFILYMLVNQEFDFIKSIIQELKIRV